MNILRQLEKSCIIFLCLCTSAFAQTPVTTSRTAIVQFPTFEAHEIDFVDNSFNVIRSEIHFLSTSNCQSALSGSYTLWGQLPNSSLGLNNCATNGQLFIVEIKDSAQRTFAYRAECWEPLPFFGILLPTGKMTYAFVTGGLLTGVRASPPSC